MVEKWKDLVWADRQLPLLGTFKQPLHCVEQRQNLVVVNADHSEADSMLIIMMRNCIIMIHDDDDDEDDNHDAQ